MSLDLPSGTLLCALGSRADRGYEHHEHPYCYKAGRQHSEKIPRGHTGHSLPWHTQTACHSQVSSNFGGPVPRDSEGGDPTRSLHSVEETRSGPSKSSNFQVRTPPRPGLVYPILSLSRCLWIYHRELCSVHWVQEQTEATSIMSIPIVTRQADSTPRRFQGVTPAIPCPGIHRLHVTPRFPRISGALFQEIPKGVTPPVLCIL